MITVRNTNAKYTWIDARDVNRDDITSLSEDYAISSELLADILDQDEQSRMEKEDDYLAFIVRIPRDEEDEDTFYMNVHNLKGMAGNLSIGPIYDCAQAILVEFRASKFQNKKKLTELTREAETASEAIAELVRQYLAEEGTV